MADGDDLGGGWVFVNTALPFGLRSAPKIFTAIADTAEWIVKQQGVEFVIHYLHDFLVVTAGDEHQGSHIMRDIRVPWAFCGVGQAGGPCTTLDAPWL